MAFLSISREPKIHLLRSSLFNSCAWAISVLINLVAIPIIIHHLGVEGYGLFVLLTGLFGYFGLLDFGFSDGVIKYVAHYLELGDYDSATRSINVALFVQMIAGSVGVLVLCVFNHQIIRLLHVSPELFNVVSISLYATAVGFFAEMLVNTYNAALKGLQRFDVLAKTTTGFSLLTTVIVISILFAGGNLLSVIIATALLTFANLGVVLVLVHRLVPGYRLSLILYREDFHALFGFGAYVFISRLASTLNSYFLQVVVAVILGPAAVAYLAVPMRLTSALEAGFNSLVGVIFPRISALRAQGNTRSLIDIYSKASKYTVALSIPVFLFVILFSKQILAVWLGAEFSGRAWPVLSVLSCASLLAVWTMVPANTIYGTGDTKVAATFGAIVAGLNLLFSILLTLRYGTVGTGAAVLITALQCPIFIWYVTSRVLNISPAQYYEQVFARHIVPAIVFSVISLIILSMTNAETSGSSLLSLAFGAGLSVFYYSFLLKFRFVYLTDLRWSG
jgi:O-antigen/teichoic acid export membrane protein